MKVESAGLRQQLDFDSWMRAVVTRTEASLQRYLPSEGTVPARLHAAMRYAALDGGKRVRPLLCHAAAHAIVGALAGEGARGGLPATLDAASAALEMIHVYSLVHDDLPCMDDDELRRGKPTVHVQYDEATALLVGDALQSQAFVTLCADAISVERRGPLVAELALASGSLGMCGGQAIDLAAVGQTLDRAELETMHRMKTGALLRAAVRMGALCASPGVTFAEAEWREPLDRYAAAIGLAFQVVDDILDVTADSATLGKTAGKDVKDNKPTYVSILGLDASRRLAVELREQALAALAPFGDNAQRLGELADLVVRRAH